MKLLITDRDGVISQESDQYIKSPDEWRPIPGSLEALARLYHAGYHIVVMTNQSGVSQSLLDIGTLHRIHEKMLRGLSEHGGSVDAIYFCPDAPDSNSRYRKPNPGMLEDLAARLRITLAGVPVVGDRWTDMEAARAVDAWPILVRTGHGEQTLQKHADLHGIGVYDDLAAVAAKLLES